MATSAVKVGEKVNIPAKQETPQMTMKDWINKSQFAISKALPSKTNSLGLKSSLFNLSLSEAVKQLSSVDGITILESLIFAK
jgi:hypothetical protein